MKNISSGILAVLVTFSGFVYAGAYSKSENTGPYVGASVGRSDVDVSDGGISFEDNDVGWKIFGGYKVNEYYSAEAAWVDLGDFSDTVSIPSLGIIAPVDLDISGFVLSGLGTYPVGESASVFGRLGIWRWDSDASVSGISADDSGTDFMFGVGGSYSFTDSFAVRAEWERYKADSDDADLISIGGVFSFK